MAETLANGTTVPQGSDPIHGSGVQAMRNLGGSVDAQLGARYTKAQADALLDGKAPVSHTHSWAQVTGKPTTFAPSAHSHVVADVTGLQAALDQAAVTAEWAQLVDKPTAFPPLAHSHSVSDVTGLQVVLDDKVDTDDPRLSDARAPLAHEHEIADVDGLNTALDAAAQSAAWASVTGKPDVFPPAVHGHQIGDVDGLTDALDQAGAGAGVSVLAFGATGDGATDDTAAFTAALASGGPVYVPGGTYRVSGAYASGPVDLTMANDAVIQHDATGPGILIEGTETPAQTEAGIALNEDAPTGTTSFAALGHGLAPGDYFRLGSELPWDASSTNIRQGEILRVATVSGSGFTSTTPVMGGPYLRSDTAAVWRLGLIEGVTIRGGTIRGPRTPNLVQTGLLIRRARNVTVEGVRFEDIDYRHAAYEDVLDWWHDRNTHDWAQDKGMAYGVAATNASQDFQVTRNIFLDTRHAFTTSNLQAVRGVTRRGYIGHNVARRTLPALNETSSGGDAFDTHTAADDMTFEYNFVDGSTGAGINVECRNSKVRFNTILNPTGAGIHVHNESDLDGATEITGNRVVAGPDTTYGIRVSPAGRGSGSTLRGVLVTGNVIEDVQSTPIYMGNRNFSPLYGVTVNDNMAVDCPGTYMVRILHTEGIIYQGNNATGGRAQILTEELATGGEAPGYVIANLTDGVIEVQPHHTYVRFSPRDDTPLRTITAGRTGQTITFRPMGSSQQVPVATNGNIVVGAPLTLNGSDDAVTLGWTGVRWSEISRRVNPVIAYDTDGVPYLAGA